MNDVENRAIAGSALKNKFIVILFTFERKIKKNINIKRIFLLNI